MSILRVLAAAGTILGLASLAGLGLSSFLGHLQIQPAIAVAVTGFTYLCMAVLLWGGDLASRFRPRKDENDSQSIPCPRCHQPAEIQHAERAAYCRACGARIPPRRDPPIS